jgi:hypothetical protein
MRGRALVVVVLCVAAGCGKDDAAPAPKPGETAVPVDKLAGLQIALPDQWTKKLDGAVLAIAAKPPLKTSLGIALATPEIPRTVDGYVQDLIANHWGEGTAAEVVAQEKLTDGFTVAFKKVVAGDKAGGSVEYHAVRDIAGGPAIRCLAIAIADDAARNQIDAICKSARW